MTTREMQYAIQDLIDNKAVPEGAIVVAKPTEDGTVEFFALPQPISGSNGKPYKWTKIEVGRGNAHTAAKVEVAHPARVYEILSSKDIGRLESLAEDNHWGFTKETLFEQIMKFRNGTEHDKAEVFYLLEECNYHEVAGFLRYGECDAALKWAEENME